MVKIGVVIFSVHPEISFGNIKSGKIAEIKFITDISGITEITEKNYKNCSKWISFLLDTNTGSFSVILDTFHYKMQ